MQILRSLRGNNAGFERMCSGYLAIERVVLSGAGEYS